MTTWSRKFSRRSSSMTAGASPGSGTLYLSSTLIFIVPRASSMTSSSVGARSPANSASYLRPMSIAASSAAVSSLDPARVAADSHEVAVVDHDDAAVAGVLDVELDVVRPRVERRAKCGHVFSGAYIEAPRCAVTATSVFELEPSGHEPAGAEHEATARRSPRSRGARRAASSTALSSSVRRHYPTSRVALLGVHARNQELMAGDVHSAVEKSADERHRQIQRHQWQHALHLDACPDETGVGDLPADPSYRDRSPPSATATTARAASRLRRAALGHPRARGERCAAPRPRTRGSARRTPSARVATPLAGA